MEINPKINYLKSKKLTIYLLLSLFSINKSFGQLEFTKEKQFLFVGADKIDNKHIVAGVYITPLDSFNLNLKIDILDNWITKDTISTNVTLDKSSRDSNLFFISRKIDSLPAYRFVNSKGLEIYIAKEIFHNNINNLINQYGGRGYSMTIVQIYLPPKSKYYVKKLPIMHEK